MDRDVERRFDRLESQLQAHLEKDMQMYIEIATCKQKIAAHEAWHERKQTRAWGLWAGIVLALVSAMTSLILGFLRLKS